MKIKTTILGWSIGMIGLTTSAFRMYLQMPILQWIGGGVATIGLFIIGLFILTAPFIFKT